LEIRALIHNVVFVGGVQGVLEVAGIELLGDYYDTRRSGWQLLDAGVLQVGHHGSYNETTQQLLSALTLRVAAVPVGFWKSTLTSGYGHRTRDTVEQMSNDITRKRSQPKTVMVADRAEEFSSLTVQRAIYATGWDGTVRVAAKAANHITAFREH
jgi:hypothetical protein